QPEPGAWTRTGPPSAARAAPPLARPRPSPGPRPLELRSRPFAAPPARFFSRSGPAPSPGPAPSSGPALRAALALRPRPLAAPPARSVSRRPGPPAGKQPREQRPRRPAPRSHPPPRLAAASAPCSGPALRLTFSRGLGARRPPTAPAASSPTVALPPSGRAAGRLLPGRADWAPGAGGRRHSAPGKRRRKERGGEGGRRLSRGRDVRAAAAAAAAAATTTAAAAAPAAPAGGCGPRARSPAGAPGRQRRLVSGRLARRRRRRRLGGRGGRPAPAPAATAAAAAAPGHRGPAAAAAPTPAATRFGGRPRRRAPRSPGPLRGPRPGRRRPGPGPGPGGGRQRRGALPARGLGPERAGEGAAAAAEAPLPGCGRAGDAAAAVLEPEGQVQLHRPVSEQPAGALQSYMGIGLSAQGVNMNRLPGIAFTDLPPNLYPTVGLQTPGEVVDANFGQHPFVFDIEDYMREWRTKTQAQIDRFPVGDREGEWQTMIQKMVSSYLVHHGYCATAEAFARSTDQTVLEELASIKNRQRIQKLVLAGRMGEAIETTQQLYPSLLERNPNLLFTLKVRQFIEMVNGTDSEVRCLGGRSPKSQDSYPVSPRPFSSPSMSPSHGVNIHSLASGKGSTAHFSGFDNCSNGVISNKAHQAYCHSKHQPCGLNVPELNSLNTSRSQQVSSFTSNDVDMETDHYSNGVGETSSNGFLNGSSKHDHEMEDCDTEMEVDSSQLRRQLCGGSQAAIERMIHFGRELQAMSEQLRRECGKNTANKKMLKETLLRVAAN
uniref:RAN binding protein 9 n=1 Tax=Bos indicus x Bos taurus TaxID=30522 RepID=A0A4W2DLH7_BOBOX